MLITVSIAPIASGIAIAQAKLQQLDPASLSAHAERTVAVADATAWNFKIAAPNETSAQLRTPFLYLIRNRQIHESGNK